MNEMSQSSRVGPYEVMNDSLDPGSQLAWAWDHMTSRRMVVRRLQAAPGVVSSHMARLPYLAHRNIAPFQIVDSEVDVLALYEVINGQSLPALLDAWHGATQSSTASGQPSALLAKMIGDVLDVMGQVCSALQYLHSRGLAHGAIGAASVWVLDDGSVKLLDVGLGRWLPIRPTPASLAPWCDSDSLGDPAADLFATGVLLGDLSAGPVERAPSTAHLAETLVDGTLLTSEGFPPAVRSLLATICQRATADTPFGGYSDAGSLGSDLAVARLTILNLVLNPVSPGTVAQVSPPMLWDADPSPDLDLQSEEDAGRPWPVKLPVSNSTVFWALGLIAVSAVIVAAWFLMAA